MIPITDLTYRRTNPINSRLTNDVEYALDAADRQAKETDVRYTHKEMISKL